MRRLVFSQNPVSPIAPPLLNRCAALLLLGMMTILALHSICVAQPCTPPQTAELLATVADGTEYGRRVLLCGDLAFVAAPAEAAQSGAVYVFERVTGQWTGPIRLTGSGDVRYIQFGAALDFDGQTLVVGAPGRTFDRDARGAAFLFERSVGVWHEALRLEPASATDRAIGTAVSIDGDALALGGPVWNDPTTTPSVHVYARSGGQWALRTRLTRTGPGANRFGAAVLLRQSTLFVGSPYEGVMRIRRYARTPDGWTLAQVLSGASAISDLGSFLAFDTGRLLASGTNQAAVYERAGEAWLPVATLSLSDVVYGFTHVTGAAISGDRALLATATDGRLAFGRGSVHVFARSGATWSRTMSVYPDTQRQRGYFGTDCALQGAEALIGAAEWPGSPAGSSAAYVYDLSILPVILTQPASWSGSGNAEFHIHVSPNPNGRTFQWRRNGVPLSEGGPHTGTRTDTLHVAAVPDRERAVLDVVVDGVCTSEAVLLSGYFPGDANCDGRIDNFDIDAFVSALNGDSPCRLNADCNHDGAVDGFDVDPFVAILYESFRP